MVYPDSKRAQPTTLRISSLRHVCSPRVISRARAIRLQKRSVRKVLSIFALILFGCGRTPTPLAPQVGGSIGMPHRGVLTRAVELPRRGEGYVWLRNDDRHYGVPRFVEAIERAAAKVARDRPGGVLAVGDLS